MLDILKIPSIAIRLLTTLDVIPPILDQQTVRESPCASLSGFEGKPEELASAVDQLLNFVSRHTFVAADHRCHNFRVHLPGF